MRLAGSLILFDVCKVVCVWKTFDNFGVIASGIILTIYSFCVAGKFCTVGVDTSSVAGRV
jgi:hypothetical protein